MSRLDDLILLENAGQLPANMQRDLDFLRANGEAPPKSQTPQSTQSAPADLTLNARAQAVPREAPNAITKAAAWPSEQVGKVPVVGGLLQALTPSTPAGWGGAAGAVATAPLTGGMSLVPAALMHGSGAVIGGTLGAMAGGTSGEEAAGQGAGQGFGQLLGELGIAPVAGWVTKQIKGIASPIIRGYGTALSKFIPGIKTDNPTATWFYNVVKGGEGDKALGKAFEDGVSHIQSQVGQDAFIQSPVISDIVRRYKKILPSAESALQIAEATKGLQGQATPAHLVVGRADQPIQVKTAITLAQELGEAARKAASTPEGAIRARPLEIANTKMRQEITDQLNKMAAGAGDLYSQLNQSYGKGKAILGVLKNGDIFSQSAGKQAKISEPQLSKAMNESLDILNRVGASELQTVASRGGPPGTGATAVNIPFMGSRIPGTPIYGRMGRGSFTVYPGDNPINNLAAGVVTGQRLIESLNNIQFANTPQARDIINEKLKTPGPADEKIQIITQFDAMQRAAQHIRESVK